MADLDHPARYRHIISVKPDLGVNLAGLGARLEGMKKEKEETAGQTLVKGRERLAEGEGRHGYGVNSPWYDGRGHRYTIIDLPNVEVKGKETASSVLTPEEILDAVTKYAKDVGEGAGDQLAQVHGVETTIRGGPDR